MGRHIFIKHLRYRDDLEQVRILADQCRRREKLRKRALASWQQNMHLLLQQAATLDHQLLASSSPSTSAKQVSPSKPAKPLFTKAQSGSKHGHNKGTASSKQAKQLAAEIADANENAQAKLAHDMALSLQLTRGVADEAAKLHHVKIIRAHSGQPGSSNGAVGPTEEAVPSGEVCPSICLLLLLFSHCCSAVPTAESWTPSVERCALPSCCLNQTSGCLSMFMSPKCSKMMLHSKSLICLL